jgi:COMPASS component SWD3
VTFLHVPTLKPLFTLQEQQNSLNTLDFSWTGKIFATGGKDFHIRIYDEGTYSLNLDTKTVIHDFQPAGWNNVGHDNRVFAVKFID